MIDTQGEFWRLFVPGQNVGANTVLMDLFNASGSARKVLVDAVYPIIDNSVAVSGVVAVNVFVTFTTAVGTGGTAATINGTSLSAATFSSPVPEATSLNEKITARLTPSGGATAGGVIAFTSLFSEETSAASYKIEDVLSRGRSDVPPLVLQEGRGIRVIQGSVASVGVIAFDVHFRVVPK